jgi:alpha-amylase
MKKINGTLMQYFHWYTSNDGNHWRKVAAEAKSLAQSGITALWLPPAFKAVSGINDVGYGVYDLYDLGEFDQKGTIRTKYGTKDEYLEAINAAHDANIQVYADLVLNHKAGADDYERVEAMRVYADNRNIEYGEPDYIDAWTSFKFPGRKGLYSKFQWFWKHFDGVDWDENMKEKAIFKFTMKDSNWEPILDPELGNYDYLMYADIDFMDPDVNKELRNWGKWFIDFTGVDGFRLDAIKHIKFDFFKDWLFDMRNRTGKELFTVGEYWNYNLRILLLYLEKSDYRMSLFDAPLHLNFHTASIEGQKYDLRRIFDNTLIQSKPMFAVTVVENHDTQPLQSLESPVESWFKPLAYAIILLREEGYPCVFYPDYYGAFYRDFGKDGQQYDITLAPVPKIEEMIKARQLFSYGIQHDYFDHPNVVGWTREGDNDHPYSGIAVLMSNGNDGWKWMEIGKAHSGEIFIDLFDNFSGEVIINPDGWGEFKTKGGSVSVWVNKDCLHIMGQ